MSIPLVYTLELDHGGLWVFYGEETVVHLARLLYSPDRPYYLWAHNAAPQEPSNNLRDILPLLEQALEVPP